MEKKVCHGNKMYKKTVIELNLISLKKLENILDKKDFFKTFYIGFFFGCKGVETEYNLLNRI